MKLRALIARLSPALAWKWGRFSASEGEMDVP